MAASPGACPIRKQAGPGPGAGREERGDPISMFGVASVGWVPGPSDGGLEEAGQGWGLGVVGEIV